MSATASRGSGETSRLRAARIYAVDDEADMLELLERAVGRHALEFRGFTDPREAIAAVRTAPPDVLITDLSMGAVSGLDVIGEVRKSLGPDRLPIVVVSAEGAEEVILDCFERGADDYIAKPFNAGELKAKIALLLARARARRATPDPDAEEKTVIPGFAGYRLRQKLGEGGMGVVYEAVAPDGQRVALKLLAPALAQDRALLSRFLREAELLKLVRHPSVAAFYAMGQHDLKYFIAMELVEGPNLDAFVRGRTPLAEAEALAIVAEIGGALGALAEHGIVHRDVKPANVLVAPGGRLKLADFGLAKRRSDEKITATNVCLGTVDYMAPEQVQSPATVDIRADLYSLGVIAYALLTGRKPFEGDSAWQVLLQHMNAPPVDPSELNERLTPGASEVVLRLLAKQPRDRFQTPRELVAAIAGR